MNTDDFEIDLLFSSDINGVFSNQNNMQLEEKKPIHKSTSRNIHKTKRGRPKKQSRKAYSSKTQSTEEKKSDDSPEIIMLDSSKMKMAKANRLMKKIKKTIASTKQRRKPSPIETPKKSMTQKEKTTLNKYQTIVVSFKSFLKELRGSLQKTISEGDKILKCIE